LTGITGLGFHPEIKLNRMADGTSATPPRKNMSRESAIIIGTNNKPSKTFI
jgi:hypothetical protein